MYQSVTIEQLVDRIAVNEDRNAYKELYDYFFPGLYRLSFSILRSSTTAEKVISDVFVRIWQIRKQLNEIENIRVYIFSLTKHFSIHHIHQHGEEIRLTLDEIPVETQIEIGHHEDLCISPATIDRLKQAIMQLSPQCRLLFQLVKEEGFQYREAAVILNISTSTARNMLCQAVKKVAEILPSYRQTAIPNIRSFSAS